MTQTETFVMTQTETFEFMMPFIGDKLERLSTEELDQLDFGVIGFDHEGFVCRYNLFESRFADLPPQRVVGRRLFTVVAPCMNNTIIAGRFDQALSGNVAMDDDIDYTLTLRMRPVRVRLRLVAGPALQMSYVLVQRAWPDWTTLQ
jgi:photoactive yellow protein